MFPKSRGPPLPSSEAFSTGQISVRSAPLPPTPSCHPVAHVQNTQVSGSSSFPKTSAVSLNIVGRLGQYRIEAATADQLAPSMGQSVWQSDFEAMLNDRLKCNKTCGIFNK